MSLPLNQVILGDCGDVMAEWPGNSVDCIVTDPPYRIGFMGSSWDRALPPRRAFRQIFRVLKPGALAFVMSSPRQDVLWRMLSMLEEIGFELRQSFVSWIYKTGFPKALDVSKGIDKKLGLERSKVTKFAENFRGGKLHAKDDSKRSWIEIQSDEAISELASKWSGWKSQTGLKPAAECILMVNKPRSEPTIVENVLKWGTGAVNVDACRIPFQNESDKELSKHNWKPESDYSANETIYEYGSKKLSTHQSHKGRFPANLLISDGALDTGETTKSGKFESYHKIAKDENGHSVKNVYGKYRHLPADQQVFYGDEGSPYRYFDLDAWAEHRGFLDVAKPSKAERDFGLSGIPLREKYSDFGLKERMEDGLITNKRTNKQALQSRNIHPTCKPVKLMAYLIELGCPPNGIVVDPFLGSGTTCIAAKRLRRRWIGIEINPEYAEIAEARINIRGPLDQFMEADG